jgi:hypothetical protein
MGFDKRETEQLLAECGRRCCICGRLHQVQVHHITPKEKGGTDDIENGIPLCPNCHDEVHTGYAPGRTTRIYTDGELKLHRKRTIERVKREGNWTPGGAEWKTDKKLIAFFAQCLDRPAFRTYFHQELSFVAFDGAMEDTLLALNTGYWRTRDGAVIQRAKGKSCIVNPDWRKKLEEIASIIENIRRKFSEASGLNRMIGEMARFGSARDMADLEDMMTGFRSNRGLGESMDEQRQRAIDIMNSLLSEVGMQPLKGIRTD